MALVRLRLFIRLSAWPWSVCPYVYLYGRGPSVHTFTCMSVVRPSTRLPVYPLTIDGYRLERRLPSIDLFTCIAVFDDH